MSHRQTPGDGGSRGREVRGGAQDGQQEERRHVKCFRATKTNTEVDLVEKL